MCTGWCSKQLGFPTDRSSVKVRPWFGSGSLQDAVRGQWLRWTLRMCVDGVKCIVSLLPTQCDSRGNLVAFGTTHSLMGVYQFDILLDIATSLPPV